ncbi:DUF3617 domain-containing protein [Methylomonas sp. MgM2]
MQQLQIHYRIAITTVLMSWTVAADAQAVMEPGGWEVQAKITAQDPTTGVTKTLNDSTMRQCLSEAFLKKDPYLTPGIDNEKMRQKGAKCSLSDQVRNKDSASWRMICEFADGSKADMSINNSVSRHEFSSEIKQLIVKGDRTVPIQIAIKSRFIGECTEDMQQQ